MNTRIFIRLPDREEQHAQWAELDEANTLLASGQFAWNEELGEFVSRQNGKPIVLLLPLSRVTLATVTVPEKQQKHLDKVLPYLLEDNLACSVDDLHIIPVEKHGEKVLAAAIPHEELQALLTQCQNAQFRPIKISLEALGLNAKEEQVVALLTAQSVLLRYPNGEASQIELAQASALLPILCADKSLSVLSTDAMAQLPVPAERIEIDHALAALCPAINQHSFDFCVHEYAPASEWHAHWKKWKPIVWTVGAAAVITYVLVMGDLLLMKYRVKQIDDQIRVSYSQAFPNESTVAYPVVSMRGYMKKFVNVGEGASLSNFLADVAPVLAESPSLVIRSAGFEAQSQTLRIDLTAPNLASLNSLVGQFQRMGYQTDMGQASSSGEGYTSRLELRRGGGKKS